MHPSRFTRWQGMTRLAMRQLQQRWLESLLILLGISLGVGVFTATQLQLRYSYEVEAQLMQSNPIMSGVRVMSQRYDSSALQEAGTTLMRIPPDLNEPMNFRAEDILAIRDAVSSVGSVIVAGLQPYVFSALAADGEGLLYIDPATGWETSPKLWADVTTPDALTYSVTFISGAPFTWEHVRHRYRVLVLHERSAKILFPDLQPNDVLGRTLILNDNSGASMWRIVGVATWDGSRVDFQAYVPVGMTPNEVIRDLLVLPIEGVEIGQLIREIEAYVNQGYPRGSVQVHGPRYQPNIRFMVSTMAASALTLLIAAVSVLNLFIARVMRRQRQTGMSAALGATRSMLFWQVGAEALLLGVIGGLLGIAVAAGLGRLLTSFLRMQVLETGLAPALSLFDVFVGLTLASAISFIFGFYPAWLASQQHPAEALRSE